MAYGRLTATLAVIALALVAISSGFAADSDGEGESASTPSTAIPYTCSIEKFTFDTADMSPKEVKITKYNGNDRYLEIPSYVVLDSEGNVPLNSDGERATVSSVTRNIDNSWLVILDNGDEYEASETVVGGKICMVSEIGNVYAVTQLGTGSAKVFQNGNVMLLYIPDSVKTIQNKAFQSSNLAQVEFGEGSKLESIGVSAFYSCSYLVSMDIPSGVNIIQNTTFKYIGSGSDDIANDVATYIGANPKITVPNSVTEIQSQAFYRADAVVVFESGSQLKTVGESAFNQLTSSYSLTITGFAPSVDLKIIENGNVGASSDGVEKFGTFSENGVTICGKDYKYSEVTEGGKKKISIEMRTVTYVYDGTVPTGVELPSPVAHQSGDAVLLPPEPSVNGYEFAWSTDDATISGGSFEMPAGNVTVTGTWSYEDYDVTFAFTGADAGVGLPDPLTGKHLGDLITLPALSADGYTFAWSTDDATISGGSFTMPAGNVTVTGTWSYVDYNVTFAFSGADAGVDLPAQLTGKHVGESIDLPALSADGYTFAWSTDDATISGGSFTMPAGNVTVTGTWTLVADPVVPEADNVDLVVFDTEYIPPVNEPAPPEQEVVPIEPVTPVTPVPVESTESDGTTASAIGDFNADGIMKVFALLFLTLGGLYVVKRELA